jgi:hypothetical protein
MGIGDVPLVVVRTPSPSTSSSLNRVFDVERYVAFISSDDSYRLAIYQSVAVP